MPPEFQQDELVVFVGHSGDARAEAEVIRKMESAFQAELRNQTRISENPPFRSVKVWEWSLDAEGKPGGQSELIDPVIDTAHIAVFVFKERIGTVTRMELERCRAPGEDRIPVYAFFPADAPDSEKLKQEEAAGAWADLLRYKKTLQTDWAKPGSGALRPLKDYADHEELERIMIEQFRRDLGGVLTRRAELLQAPGESHGELRGIKEWHPRDDFLSRVETVCRLRESDRTEVKRIRPGFGGMDYLRVSVGEGGIHRVYPVGAVTGGVTRESLDSFMGIHDGYRKTDSGVISILVYGGDPAPEEIVAEASRQRIRLRSFVEYQGLLDFRPYVEKQTSRLADDPLYPPSLYVPQRMGFAVGEEQQEAVHRALEGHQDYVQSVAFSPDSKTLASGSYDKTVRLWNSNDGTLLRALEGHQHYVSSVAFSHDGMTLASGSYDKTVRLWNTNDGTLLRALEGHQHYVSSVAFSPGGKTIASGSLDKTVRLWSSNDGPLLRALEGHQNYVYSVAFSPDGNTLASGSLDNTVRLWNSNDGKLLRALEGHQNYVYSVAFSPDGNTLASGSLDNTVRFWDVATGRCLAILGHLPEGWVAFTPEGRYKLGGEIAGGFWHSINLCRFEPGELDPYLPEPLRMPDDEPFISASGGAQASLTIYR